MPCKRGISMFSLIKDLGVRIALKQEAIPFLIAFAVAEFFFKFKSFALECLAFLAVWFVLSSFKLSSSRTARSSGPEQPSAQFTALVKPFQ